MAIPVTCDQCGRQYSVKEEAAGKRFKCKECGAVVAVPEAAGGDEFGDEFGDLGGDFGEDEFGAPVAPAPVAGRPRRRKVSGSGSAEAASRTNLPAILIYVVAGLSIVYSIVSLVFHALGFQPAGPGFANPQQQMGQQVGQVIGIVFLFLFLVRDAFLIYAARKLQTLESYGIAMTGAILCVVPCLGSPCCALGIPFGIWALVVLNDPAVKAAFR